MFRWISCILLLLASLTAPALAEKGKLRERLTPEVMAVVFPAGAERLGQEEGSPPAIAVYQGDKVAAYVFSTLDIVAATGYSTTPFDVIAGIDLDGRITGAKVVFHNENYIVHDRVRQRFNHPPRIVPERKVARDMPCSGVNRTMPVERIEEPRAQSRRGVRQIVEAVAVFAWQSC